MRTTILTRRILRSSMDKAPSVAFSSAKADVITVGSNRYTNVMKAISSRNTLAYTLERKNFPVYAKCTVRNPESIKKAALASDKVSAAIKTLVDSKQLSQKRAEDVSRGILDTMGHTFNMTAVRSMVYPAKMILERMFSSGVYVNEDAIPKLHQLCTESPVLFMPTHKTYLDFILTQFLCFHYALPLPAIASAQDFLQMKFMSGMLRKCGAYFIRRSFNDDPLYKALFSAYVQSQLVNGDSTMQAFIEGARSRTGKSLHPKFGFLTCAIEPFLSGQMFDLHIVPVSITYDKILEESLYAYEMIGFGKPKESTLSLLKARSVLSSANGQVFINFQQPISVREFFAREQSGSVKIDRSVHHTVPGDQFGVTDAESAAIRRLAYEIVQRQQSGLVVGLWPLVCLEVGRMLAYTDELKHDDQPIIDYREISKGVSHLYNLARRLGDSEKIVNVSSGDFPRKLEACFEPHSNLLEFTSGSYESVQLQPVYSTAVNVQKGLTDVAELSLHLSTSRMMLAHYANQCLHLFMPFSYLAASFRASDPESTLNPIASSALKSNFTFLQKLLAKEFVWNVDSPENSFESLLAKAIKANILSMSADDRKISVERWDDVQALKFMLEPFLINYYMCVDCLCSAKLGSFTMVDFLKLIQTGSLSRLNPLMFGHPGQKNLGASDRAPSWYQIISVDTTRNCLHTLLDLGAVSKHHESVSNVSKFKVASESGLLAIKNQLAKLLDNFYDTNKVEQTEEVTTAEEFGVQPEKIRAKL